MSETIQIEKSLYDKLLAKAHAWDLREAAEAAVAEANKKVEAVHVQRAVIARLVQETNEGQKNIAKTTECA
jgi:hypothetical protein